MELWQVAIYAPGAIKPIISTMATRAIAEMQANALKRLLRKCTIEVIPPIEVIPLDPA